MKGRVLARRSGGEFVSTAARRSGVFAAAAAVLGGAACFEREPWLLSRSGFASVFCGVAASALWERPQGLRLDPAARLLRLHDGGSAPFEAVERVSVALVAWDGVLPGRDYAACLQLSGGRRFLLGDGWFGGTTRVRARALAAELAAATGAPLVDEEPEKI